MGKKSGQQGRYSRYVGSRYVSKGGRGKEGIGKTVIALGRLSRWGLTACLASVLSVVAHSAPAQAEELTDWNYDSQTRSLNVILPNSVAPSVSILAPDQLLLELPDTQIGDVAGQTVDDGVVESVVLEQTTPETVWMVVEFAEGTVLADQQTVTPTDLAGETMQQWQVKPALMASSRMAAVPVATNDEPTNDVSTDDAAADETIDDWTNSPADSLRTPAVDVAQSPDFSDLPVLEPAISVDESVSVPPIDARPSAGSSESIPIPVEPAPAEPPFIGEVGSDEVAVDEMAVDEIAVDEMAAEAEVAAPDAVAEEEPLPADERLADLPPFESESVAAEPAAAEPVASESFEPAPVADTPVPPSPSANETRWAEPIPFGQPLP